MKKMFLVLAMLFFCVRASDAISVVHVNMPLKVAPLVAHNRAVVPASDSPGNGEMVQHKDKQVALIVFLSVMAVVIAAGVVIVRKTGSR